MKKNKKFSCSDSKQRKNNIIRLINNKSKVNTSTKYYLSRNLFSKNKNKTSSNFSLYKIPNRTKFNNSRNINTKKDETFKNDIKSKNNKYIFANSTQIGQNFFRRILNKHNRSEILSRKICDMKNLSEIIHYLNLTEIKKRKIDCVRNKILLEQKNHIQNYCKKLFQKDELGTFLNYSQKKIIF